MKVSYIICETIEERIKAEDYFMSKGVYYLTGKDSRSDVEPVSEGLREHIEGEYTVMVLSMDGNLFCNRTEDFLYRDDLHKFTQRDLEGNIIEKPIVKGNAFKEWINSEFENEKLPVLIAVFLASYALGLITFIYI